MAASDANEATLRVTDSAANNVLADQPPIVLDSRLGSPTSVAQSINSASEITNMAQLGFPNSSQFPFIQDNYRDQPVTQMKPFKAPDVSRFLRPADGNTTAPQEARQEARRSDQQIFARDQVTELRLNNRASNHGSPDAVVHIPRGFDPTKPINVVIYNHGFGSTASGAYRDNQLGRAMAQAPPNTILVVPEWQSNPSSRSGDQGRLRQPGMFNNMLQELFDRTDGLRGKRVDQINSISIFAHSAGYGPLETQIYSTGLGSKVANITMLDATYRPHGLDRWLRDNIRDLHAGTKTFTNIFNGTAGASRDQARRIRGMLADAGLPATSMLEDSNGSTPLSAARMAGKSIVFKFSSQSDGNRGPHLAIPSQYFGPVLDASGRRPARR